MSAAGVTDEYRGRSLTGSERRITRLDGNSVKSVPRGPTENEVNGLRAVRVKVAQTFGQHTYGLR